MSNSSNNLILDDYSCVYDPITYERMTDPYITKYGHTFEKQTILNCIKNSKKCPLTNGVLTVNDIIPNRAIMDIIENINKQNIIIPNKIEKTVFKTFQINNKLTDSNPIEINFNLCEKDQNYLTNINLKSIVQTNDLPISICCIIDVSYSMDSEIIAKNNDGTKKEDGFSVLDVVKYCLKTIVNSSINKNIEIAIIAFSSNVLLVNEFCLINNGNISTIEKTIDSMKTTGTTEMWKAIKFGYDYLSKQMSNNQNRNYSMILLTDGIPSSNPPHGFKNELEILQKNNKITFPIHTFGFGNNLVENLLPSISNVSNGINSYIADGSTLATFVIHTCSIIMNITCQNINIKIMDDNDNVIIEKHVGFIQTDLERNIYIAIPKNSVPINSCLNISYDFLSSEYNTIIPVFKTEKLSLNTFSQIFSRYIAKQQVIDFIDNARSLIKRKLTIDFSEIFTLLELQKSDSFISNIIKTLEDQIVPALTTYFNTWGKQYISSLMNALELEVKTNFKDEMLLDYGKGLIFTKLIEDNTTIFSNLSPQKPSLQVRSSQPIQSMSSYNNQDDSCFHEDCLISALRNGDFHQIKLSDLTIDDEVLTKNKKFSKIKYILQTKCENDKQQFVRLKNNLLATPYHPVFIDNKWKFPIDINDNIETLKCKYIYSISLVNGDSVFINDVQCIALGHNIKNDDVASHNFFGKEIDEQIKQHPDYSLKRIILNPCSLVRNMETNMIEKFNFFQEIVA
jgi:uncharacterized protein YegL